MYKHSTVSCLTGPGQPPERARLSGIPGADWFLIGQHLRYEIEALAASHVRRLSVCASLYKLAPLSVLGSISDESSLASRWEEL